MNEHMDVMIIQKWEAMQQARSSPIIIICGLAHVRIVLEQVQLSTNSIGNGDGWIFTGSFPKELCSRASRFQVLTQKWDLLY